MEKGNDENRYVTFISVGIGEFARTSGPKLKTDEKQAEDALTLSAKFPFVKFEETVLTEDELIEKLEGVNLTLQRAFEKLASKIKNYDLDEISVSLALDLRKNFVVISGGISSGISLKFKKIK